MKARPILFSAPMIRALLDGRKTQTRRIVKLPDDGVSTEMIDGWPHACNHLGLWFDRNDYGRPGDLLWVREMFGDRAWYSDLGLINKNRFYYAADGKRNEWKYKPSIHMPRIASRLTLEITDVRVQRLQEINENDAIAEGIERLDYGWQVYDESNNQKPFASPISSYASLWRSINGVGSWDVNPWVWALTFKVHQHNIDDFLKVRAA